MSNKISLKEHHIVEQIPEMQSYECSSVSITSQSEYQTQGQERLPEYCFPESSAIFLLTGRVIKRSSLESLSTSEIARSAGAAPSAARLAANETGLA